MSVREHFDEQLKELQQDLLQMESATEEMLYKSIEALKNRDERLVFEVYSKDDIVDNLNLVIENKCLELLALQQPMARDLRTIASAMKIITDIERIGDYCVDIAKMARQIIDQPLFKPLVDIPKMAEIVKGMLKQSIEAFVNRDLVLLKKIIDDDEEADHLHRYLFDELLNLMEKDTKIIKQAVYLLLISRYLERIADHITNICERIYYMETGELRELH